VTKIGDAYYIGIGAVAHPGLAHGVGARVGAVVSSNNQYFTMSHTQKICSYLLKPD